MLRNTLIAAVVLLASQAQASFVLGEFESQESTWSETFNADLVSDVFRTPLPEPQLEEPAEEEEPAPVPPPPASMSNSQHSVDGPVDAPSAVVDLESSNSTPGWLNAWLRSESQIEIPASHNQRIFRPPRVA